MDRMPRHFKSAVAACLLCLSPALALADDARLDELFDQLAHAETEDAGRRIESAISREMMRTGSPTLDLLMQRGADAIEARDHAAAVEHLTALIDHEPGLAQAWNLRAVGYYMTGAIGPALHDLGQALILEPRHFRALQGLAVVLEELGQPEDALEILRAALAIAPRDADIEGAVQRLETRFAGTPL